MDKKQRIINVTFKLLRRNFQTSTALQKKVIPTNLKGKSVSSQQWIARQLSDPYVEKAKRMNYRCRSAFKLLELDDRFKFLKPGSIVVDCGAAPGSWTQVAVDRVNADGHLNADKGIVIAVDKLNIYPLEHATILGSSDFTSIATQERIMGLLGDKRVNAVLSDMAPNATGIRDMDKENITNLCYVTLRFAIQVSEVDATLVMKLWECGQRPTLEKDILKFYKSVKIIKPDSSRADSAELFLLGRGFKGLKTS